MDRRSIGHSATRPAQRPPADQSGNRNTGDASASGITFGTPSPVEASSGSGIKIAGGADRQHAAAALAPDMFCEALLVQHDDDRRGPARPRTATAATGHNADQDRGVWMDPERSDRVRGVDGPDGDDPVARVVHRREMALRGRQPGEADGMHLYLDGQQVASDPTNVAQDYNYTSVASRTIGPRSLYTVKPANDFTAATVTLIYEVT